jgi:glycerol uptake facilitator-like aquaporin
MLVGGQLIATSSTMFANPQVTFARMFTYSAAGVTPLDGAIFILMQIVGAVLAVLVFKAVTRKRSEA